MDVVVANVVDAVDVAISFYMCFPPVSPLSPKSRKKSRRKVAKKKSRENKRREKKSRKKKLSGIVGWHLPGSVENSVMPALKRTRLTASAWRKTNWCINCVLMRVMERRERDNS